MEQNREVVENPWPFEKVLTAEQLRSLPLRAPNFELENQVLTRLTMQASQNSAGLLQTLTDTIATLYPNVSACVSLFVAGDADRKFRWAAMSGSYGNWLSTKSQGGIPFPENLKTHQVLRLPFSREGHELGNLWLISHTPETAFDQEDLRVLKSAAVFAAIAVQLNEASTTDHRSLDDEHNSYLAKLSHDMRSPLGAIIGFSDLLKGEELSKDDQNKFLTVIGRNAQSLLKMVDGILKSSQNNSNPAATSTTSTALTGKKVLIVDDLADNRGLLSLILKSSGAAIDLAVDGSEGVQKALAHAYDVIVMDLQMPVMDGYQALAKIRENHCYTPILALTANATAGQREIALGKGFHGFATKPIQRDQFIETLAKLAEQVPAVVPNSPSKAAITEAKTGPRILVIEDDSDVRELIEFVSTQAGATTHVASTGAEALKILESGIAPDLIFLDLTLPDLTGAEVIAKIHGNEKWNNAKVILLSGKDNLSEQAKQLGATGSLMKPFDVDQLENTIKKFSSR